MRTITIEDKKYSIPQSWDDITLEKQIQVTDYMNTFTNQRIKSIAMLAGYCDIPLQVVKHMKLTEANKLAKQVKFLNEPLPTDAITEFEFNGDMYYIGQNLLDTEFQDFVSIQNILGETSGNTIQSLPTILAIMCKRIKKDGTLETLDDYNLDVRAKEFKKLKLTIAHRMSLFFYHSTSTLLITSQLFSNPKKLVEMEIEKCKNIINKQVGVGWLTRLLYGILLYYLKFIEKRLDKYFTS